MANKIYLQALPEALPGSIAEVACGCSLPVEVGCPEASREEFWFSPNSVSREQPWVTPIKQLGQSVTPISLFPTASSLEEVSMEPSFLHGLLTKHTWWLLTLLLRTNEVAMSLPVSRDTLRAEIYEGYFNFKQLRICAHVSICNNFI